MPISVAILGLGRLGRSLGLAMSRHADLSVSGYDADQELGRAAQRAGAVKRAEWKLVDAVAKADLVLIATQLAEQPDLLKAVAPNLRENCVVASVSPLMRQPLAWAAEFLHPASRGNFVAAHPIFNPALLHNGDSGPESASADLFQGGLWALAPAAGGSPEASKLVADLARLLEAMPYFMDPSEHDGLAAATEALPAIMAWALFQAATASPGWSETRKLADRSLATATVALAGADFGALRYNSENVLRCLDAAMVELQTLRRSLAEADGDNTVLQHSLASLADQRAVWLAARQRGEWEAPGQPPAGMLSSGEVVSRLLVGGLFARKSKDTSGG